MEMRETVERMVMVRTTGSDLQPAATGYIYKKETDGPASVIKMEETEVMDHLTKLYEEPNSYPAPIPVAAGPFYAKEDEDKAASTSSESKLIPVVENQEGDNDDHIDGIANEDYGKILGEYASDFGDYKSDFDEYLKSLGYFEDGIYNEQGGGNNYGSQGHHAYGDSENKGYGIKHNQEKGGSGDYHSEKYETFKVSGNGGHKKDHDEVDAYGNHYANEHGYNGANHKHKSGHDNDEGVKGFHKLFDKDEYKKDHDFYDGEAFKGGIHKFNDGHTHYGSDTGELKNGGSHDSGYHQNDFGKGGFHVKESKEAEDATHSAEEGGKSSNRYRGDFGAKGGRYHGKSYGFEVKH